MIEFLSCILGLLQFNNPNAALQQYLGPGPIPGSFLLQDVKLFSWRVAEAGKVYLEEGAPGTTSIDRPPYLKVEIFHNLYISNFLNQNKGSLCPLFLLG